jgi:hypothetical protein
MTSRPIDAIRNGFNRGLAVAFVLGITVPLILGIPDFEIPPLEPRRSFNDRFDRELELAFGLRDRLVRAHHWLSCFVLHTSPSPRVVLGKDDWLYYNGDTLIQDASPIADYRGTQPLPIGDLEALRWGYQDQYDWLRLHGIGYGLVFIPSKPFIHPEQLPAGCSRGATPSWREQMIAYLRAHTDVPVLDVTPALLEARQRDPVWPPTDSHWNQYAAFVGYTAICDRFLAGLPGFEPITEDQFVKAPEQLPGGDLADMLGLADCFPTRAVVWKRPFRPGTRLEPESDDSYARLIGGTGNPNQPRAVVYRDSFSKEINPLLAEHFREVEINWWRPGPFWRQHGGWQMEGIEDKRPDLVLHIFADRMLPQHVPYAQRIQAHYTRERYAKAARTLALGSTEAGFEAFRPRRRASFSFHEGSLVVHAERDGARMELPVIPHLDDLLPILRLEIRPPSHSFLRLIEPAPPDRFWRSEGERVLWREGVERGTNVLTIPIIDPEVRQPLLLDLGTTFGHYLIHRIEIRGFPRYAASGQSETGQIESPDPIYKASR